MKRVAAILGVICLLVVLMMLSAVPVLACGEEEGTHAEGECTGHGATSASVVVPAFAGVGLVGGGAWWYKRRRGK